jgi:heterotetrameric sarcosine oxidase gamma subunit
MNDRVRKITPLYITTQALGARFVDLDGWQVPEAYGSTEEELAVARQGVVVADASANGKWLIEGQTAAGLLGEAWALPDLPVGLGAAVETGRPGGQLNVYRLRPELYFASVAVGEASGPLEALAGQAGSGADLLTVTDISHGRAELWLVGPTSAELLSRLCGLDFHDSRFPDGAAKQSSLAKTTQLIIRRDLDGLPCYALIGDRSLAAYLWDTIVDAGSDLDIRPIGRAALVQLQAG